MRKGKSFQHEDGEDRDGREGAEDIMVLGDDDGQRVGCRQGRQMRMQDGREREDVCVFFATSSRSRPSSIRTARLRLAPNPHGSVTGVSSWPLMELHGGSHYCPFDPACAGLRAGRPAANVRDLYFQNPRGIVQPDFPACFLRVIPATHRSDTVTVLRRPPRPSSACW